MNDTSQQEQPILLWQLTRRGFGSEINSMVLAILYSLAYNYKFVLYSKTANFAYQDGWRDYFLPFCEEIDHFALAAEFIFKPKNWLFNTLVAGQKRLLRRSVSGPFFITPEKWHDIRSPKFFARKFSIDGLNNTEQKGVENRESYYDGCRKIVQSIWKFNDYTMQRVGQIMAQFDLDTPYCTVHIRRGDKTIEAEHTETEKYIDKIRQINPDINRMYLITGDYKVFEELNQQYPELEFFTLCGRNERGYNNWAFNWQSKEKRKEAILRLLASLSIAQNGLFFVGTYSSNIARLVALLRGKETVYDVHGREFGL